jgi:hypothetical protein
MSLKLTIPSFTDRESIPVRFSRDGGNISPAIEWHGAPAGTKSYALVVEDPDAPNRIFRHWAVYNIAPETHRLAEGAGSALNADTIRTATNDFGNARYDGPQPPRGHGAHHYHFVLFALDVADLGLADRSRAEDVLVAARRHAIDFAEAIGTFGR